MPLVKLGWSGFLDFVRRERIYFLLILLGLAIILMSEPVHTHEKKISPKVQALQAAAQSFEDSSSIAQYIHLFTTHPLIIFFVIVLISIIFFLFVGGSILVLIYEIFPACRYWLADLKNEVFMETIPVAGCVGFRAMTLIFFLFVASGMILGEVIPESNSVSHAWPIVHTLIIDLMACLAVFAALKTEGVAIGTYFSLRRISFAEELKRGFLTYAGAFPLFCSVLLAVLGISAWMHYEPPLHPLVEILTEEQGRSPFIFYGALTLAAFAAPVMEEIFFRGFIYRLFRGWGTGAATVVSASLFAALHGSGFAFFPIFFLGIVLAWLYEKRGSLVACWTFHILHNILFTAYFLAMKALIGAF